jgi:hypothetical protein
MARTMKTVHAPRTESSVLVIVVDPLGVARGCRQLKRGGVHQTARKPSRAKAKRRMRREMVERTASCRGRMS